MTNPKDIQGLKKPQMHLIPHRDMKEVAKVMKTGADKYGEWNWRDEDIQVSKYISACERHLGAWFEGEDLDESGQNHIDHAIATLLILRDSIIGGNLIDDRPKK